MLRPTILVTQIWVPKSLFGEVFGSYVSQTKLSILLGEFVMRLYPQWSTLPDNKWGPLISATAAIPAPKMLDDLLDEVTLITKLPLKHNFELLEAQKKCTCFSSPKLKLLSFWVLSDGNNTKKQSQTIFFLWVPQYLDYVWWKLSYITQFPPNTNSLLAHVWIFFFCHSISVTHHSSLITPHSSL